MTKGEKIRAVAIVLFVALIFLFINFLLSNSYGDKRKSVTEEFALVNGRTLAAMIKTVENDTIGMVQASIEGVQLKYKDIKTVSVIDGKKFVAHSDTSLVGERISKELYDAQQKLLQNFKENRDFSYYQEWNDDRSQLLISLPIVDQGEIINTLGIEITPKDIPPLSSNLFLWIIALIVVIALILVDKFAARFKTPAAIIVMIFGILIPIIIITNGINRQVQDWENQKGQIVKDNFDIFVDVGAPVYFEQYVQDVNIEEDDVKLVNIENWKALSVTEDYISDKKSQNFGAALSWIITLSVFGVILMLVIFRGGWEKLVHTVRTHRLAYMYTIPAMLGVFLLVFFPFVYGFLIGFTDYNINNFGDNIIEYFTTSSHYTFRNFVSILSDFNITDYNNFYFTAFHTIMWTVLNVGLHVTIGVLLALVLNNPKLKGRTFFRIILILPWAVPNYITALIWRGMFHKQFGAVNGLLNMLGFDSVSWFLNPITSFLANLTTNVWLGFPFMMVIALGALQSIPKELYEASHIDGATRWQSFWNITFPLLKPAMVPAIILGTIWTFNQFNVIYLVSGGAPDGATEILITDAYRIAFEQYRYGYASAYCIVIFLMLMAFGIYTSKVTKATEGVYE